MAKLITVEKVTFAKSPSSASQVLDRAELLCEELENGNILFFPEIPFDFAMSDQEFLLSQKQTSSTRHKNIAYKPNQDKISNAESKQQEILQIMRNYSSSVEKFLSKLLIPYAQKWKLDYASFRPFQEENRKLRVRARNDLLHTDAFPSRPMHGNRILRFFTNINQQESRKWITSENFEILVEKFMKEKKIPGPKPAKYSLFANLARKMKMATKQLGLKVPLRSPYDQFMLEFHHFLKENKDFQKNCHKDFWNFPPGSCWAVFTDQVTHAALKGQYALEQTFLIPKSTLLFPEKAPISILERLVGQSMVDAEFSCQ